MVEKIVNGSFTTGTFEGWTTEGSPTIYDLNPHTPPYYCVLTNLTDKIYQTFNIKWSYVQSLGFWYYYHNRAIITISVGGVETEYTFDQPEVTPWTYVDLKAQLEAIYTPPSNAYIVKLAFSGAFPYTQVVDDISLDSSDGIASNYGVDVLLAESPVCESCHTNKAVYNIRIINMMLCYECFRGLPVNGKIYQTGDYSKIVVS